MHQTPIDPEAALRSMKLLFHGPKASSLSKSFWEKVYHLNGLNPKSDIDI